MSIQFFVDRWCQILISRNHFSIFSHWLIPLSISFLSLFSLKFAFVHNRDAILTSVVNCLTSLLAGFVIFSVLGYMAHVLNKDIENVATGGPGLVFTVYPEALATMSGSSVWSVMFFLMLITLGLDSTFGGLEAMITGLCDQHPKLLRRHREVFVAFLLLFIWLCALPTTTYVSSFTWSSVISQQKTNKSTATCRNNIFTSHQGGNYVVMFLDTYGTSTSLLFIVFIESVAVSWFYGRLLELIAV